jgi:DNA-binding NtrC family response regulator
MLAQPTTTRSADTPTLELPLAPPRPALALVTDTRPPLCLIPGRPLLLGSAPAADLRLDDAAVSARHARITWDHGACLIEDLGSTNGTYVDGVRVRQAWLSPGVHLRLGRWRAHLVDPERAAAAAHEPVPSGMLGRAPAFTRTLAALHRFAPLDTTVLLRGPTGSGKELAARAIHEHSRRAAGPYVALNCAAIPEGLCESELFGHVRGAFTGAQRPHLGAFQRARGGTLFLDEIGELPLHLQAILLRALETRRITQVGGEHEIPVDVRVIAATHRPLEAWIDSGRFREDLFHRLGVLTVALPALNERSEDIPLLLERFAAAIAEELARPVQLTEEAILAATRHPWPGNIRQLRNALMRAAALCDGPITAADLLPPSPHPTRHEAAAIPIPRGSYAAMNQALLSQVVRESGSIRKAARDLGVPRSTLGAWLRRGE